MAVTKEVAQGGDATLVLSAYAPESYNVLVPTTTLQRLTPFHQIRVEEVHVDPDPDHGEVYKVGSSYDKVAKRAVDFFALAKPALMGIAAAAGIMWNWRDSGVTERTPRRIVYRAIGAVRTASGEWTPIPETKEIDLDVIEDENRDQLSGKVDGLVRDGGLSYEDAKAFKCEWRKVAGKEQGDKERNVAFLDATERERWIETHLRTAMIQWRKNALMRAETGALERVIRALMKLKPHYTAQELARPFVLTRVDFAPDYTAPDVRRYMLEAGAKGQTDVFGPAQTPMIGAGAAPSAPRPRVAPEGETLEAVVRDFEPAVPASEDDLPFGSDLPFGDEAAAEPAAPASEPAMPLPATRGTDGQGEWIGCQTPGCDGRLRPGKGRTVTEVETYCLGKWGKVLCAKCQSTGQGRML